eukprot:TRINITY_DN11106_c0_g2_i1.p2 TRINITY_DN11106_c0_g2~~TRINITY_DN11106_c0_g2_i1.p2  ORF type:complete len:321 (+),score=35.20 TRINITY_DN11106_c0_g2_i1:3802-4764(+)
MDPIDLIADVLPTSLAQTILHVLQASKPDDLSIWKEETTRPGAQRMRYLRLRDPAGTIGRATWQKIEAEVEAHLALTAWQHLRLNVSCYRPGDHLDLHFDDSTSSSIRRKTAIVIHLRGDPVIGGEFIDCFATVKENNSAAMPRPKGQIYKCVHNQALVFSVPRPHRVAPVKPNSPLRYAIYGWIMEPTVDEIDPKQISALLATNHADIPAIVISAPAHKHDVILSTANQVVAPKHEDGRMAALRLCQVVRIYHCIDAQDKEAKGFSIADLCQEDHLHWRKVSMTSLELLQSVIDRDLEKETSSMLVLSSLHAHILSQVK